MVIGVAEGLSESRRADAKETVDCERLMAWRQNVETACTVIKNTTTMEWKVKVDPRLSVFETVC